MNMGQDNARREKSKMGKGASEKDAGMHPRVQAD
jgi:hypothetical protein